jgi:Kef-type K+ transport system membrane component KefB
LYVTAVLVGIIGAVIPFTMGMIVFWLIMGLDPFPNAFAASVAITPASVGVAMRVLMSSNKLNTSYGQAILTAANIDDLMAIILFIILTNVVKDDINAIDIALPLTGAFIFVILGLYLGKSIIPNCINSILNRISRGHETYVVRDKVHMYVLFVALTAYSAIGHYIGSHLLGAFIAGFTFSKVKRSMIIWRLDIKPYMSWLLRFFFASTVAFNIDVSKLFEVNIFLQGLLVAVVCIISKPLATLLGCFV